MKKLFISFCLLLAVGGSVFAQAFVPDPNKVYNIVETVSKLVVSPSGDLSGRDVVISALKNFGSQAFKFVPLAGQPDTYNIVNADNMYLGLNTANSSWNYWNAALDPTATPLFSDWVIVGTDSTGIRLMNNQNLNDLNAAHGRGPEHDFLGSDGITTGSTLYADKSSTFDKGLYELHVATIDNSPTFEVSKKVVIEVEKGLDIPYPITISATKQNYDITATLSGAKAASFLLMDAGYNASDFITFTPADFAAGSGKASFSIMEATANLGDTVKVIFSHTSGGVVYKIDSITVTVVTPYDRIVIKNNASNNVISSDVSNPANTKLDVLSTTSTNEELFLRPVHKNVNDSLYYIILGGSVTTGATPVANVYSAFMRDPNSGYATRFGILEDSVSVWKITPMASGISKIHNMSRGDLGTDQTGSGSGVWCDKTFNANPTSGPWCEWNILNPAIALDPTNSALSSVALSSGFLDIPFASATTSYTANVPADVDSITVTGNTLSTLSTITVATITTNSAELKVGAPAVLTVTSSDLASTTNYNFTLAKNNFSTWTAGTSTTATPKQYGWKCPNANWNVANSTDNNSCRYFDNPVDYLDNGVAGWTGRALLLYWDGNVKADSVYSFPVSLEGGKSYAFTGKYAWSSVNPLDVDGNPLSSTFTFGINTQSDNKGTSVASLDSIVQPADLMNFHDAKLTFTPATDGVYYLTIKNNLAIKAAVAGLDITIISGFKSVVSSSVYATVSNQTVNVHGTLAGDAVKVYNISGQLVKQLTATSDITSINLKSGVYLIKFNANVLKVVE